MTRTFSPDDIASALHLAAAEIEWAYQHGLHEHGIPVPEILRSLEALVPERDAVTAREAESNRRLFARIDALEAALQGAREVLRELLLHERAYASWSGPFEMVRALEAQADTELKREVP